MKRSLSTYGQLQAVVAMERAGKMELVDGFKRHAAATAMGWPTLLVRVRPLEDAMAWAMMLALNYGSKSMTELEEALVLQELALTGMTQAQMAALVQRHKTWVSRRLGLVERLHPELVEGMKLGVLPPGVARRLLALPPGNQLQLATAAQSARLGPRDTELLVSLWQKATDAEVRKTLLSQPRAALTVAHPESQRATVDVRLTPPGRQLARLLAVMTAVARRTLKMLPVSAMDLPLLAKQMKEAKEASSQVASALGLPASVESASESARVGEIG
jgi:ParB-like chromosome segregation protein Spo0J